MSYDNYHYNDLGSIYLRKTYEDLENYLTNANRRIVNDPEIREAWDDTERAYNRLQLLHVEKLEELGY